MLNCMLWVTLWVTALLGTIWFFNSCTRDSLLFVLSEEEKATYLNSIDGRSEEKTRQMWLIAFFLNMAKDLLVSYSFSASTSFFLGSCFSNLISCFAIYHCAYKKKGAGLILLSVVNFPVLFGVPFLSVVSSLSVLELVKLLFVFVIGMFYWICCIRLHRANSVREYQVLLALREKFGPHVNGFCL